MNLKKVSKRFIMRFSGNFEPHVRIGTKVSFGSLLGVGDYYKVLQEIPLAAIDKLLVDDGVFVVKGTELAISLSLLKKKIFTADNDGIVRITENVLQIVEIEPNHKYYSYIPGFVDFVNTEKIKINAWFYKYWLFASLGSYVKGVLYFVDAQRPIVTSRDLPVDIKGKIVFIPSFLTQRLILKAINLGALGIIGTSIDYSEYVNISSVIKYINLGILTGFGNLRDFEAFSNIFRIYHNYYVEVDFSNEFVYFPVREILAYKKQYLLFSGDLWAKKVTIKEELDNNFVIVKLHSDKNKEIVVNKSEVFVL